MPSRIPIANIYYLLCYAWNRFAEGRAIDVGRVEAPDIKHLFAVVLRNGLTTLLRRGLDRRFLEKWEDVAGVRGRIGFRETLSRLLHTRAQIHCQIDELNHDVLHNQILRSTIRVLLRDQTIEKHLDHQLRVLDRKLTHITPIRITADLFSRVQLNRNNAFYDFLLRICELVHHCLLPHEGGTGGKFSDVLEDETRMSRVFEDFVRNFYRLEQNKFGVASERILWKAGPMDSLHESYLPTMQTDITLRSATRTIVIDTKYYKDALVSHHSRTRLHSQNLYQLYSYMKNMEGRPGPDGYAEGILLYPTVETSLDLTYCLDGHIVRIATVDLNAPWKDIDARLRALIVETTPGHRQPASA